MKIKITILLIVLFYAFAAVAWASPVDVTTFGAVGNDSTDNSTPIQNAINSLSPAGGTVYFPPGLYRVYSTIYVPSNIRLQGIGSTIYNTQIRLASTNTALFEVVENGASNIVFKDLTLATAVSPVWPRSSATETGYIRGEGTIGISFRAGSRGISNIVIENVRTTMFTNGISATSTGSGYNRSITDVKIRNYASDGNEYSLYTNTTGASDWDVQNMNVYPMYDGQNGIFLERSGEMRFLQLSCAGTNANICAKLWNTGDLYFRQMHVEGARLGFCVGSTTCTGTTEGGNTGENSSTLTVESSATDGEFHRLTKLVSINNRFWLDYPSTPAPPAYSFYDTGTNSTLTACANVWISWSPFTHMSNTTVTPPSGTFYGLPAMPTSQIQGCVESDLTSVPVFSTGYDPDNERLASSEIDVTGFPYGAIPNDGFDDTSAFNLAIYQASVNRGMRVFVPAGTYEIRDTLELYYDGQIIVGEEGSILHLKGDDLSLFRIQNRTNPIKGIALRNLILTSDSTSGTFGINFENYSASVVGAASDYQIQNVDFSGFEAGVVVRPVGGILSNANPMFDSVSVKDGDFNDNKTAILTRSANASNWNLEDIRVDIPSSEEGVRIDNGGVSIRGLSCVGTGTSTACLTIQRQGVVPVDGMNASGVLHALVARWENGWTQFPVTVRNSNLFDGVYFQGRTYLNSIRNIYPASIFSSITKDVKFGAYGEGDPLNVAFGGQSDIFTCDDTFTDGAVTQSTWAYSGTLLTPETYCY